MEELLENAREFLESGEDNLVKGRFNVAVSDFFKAIAIFSDYLIYREMKIMPKNHNDRFSLLKKYFEEVYERVSELFKIYTESYNLRLGLGDVNKVRSYANELKDFINKK